MAVEAAPAPRDRLQSAWRLHGLLWVFLFVSSGISIIVGAAGAQVRDAVFAWVTTGVLDPTAAIILFDIRLPRLAMGLLVGAALAVSGAVMQGLFRNPLADPGLVGVSAGAGLGAISAIVLGALLPLWAQSAVGNQLVPISAFLGGWISTLVLYRVSTQSGRTSVATMLLAGIALGALAGAVSGILVYMADDRQLRDLTFWGLGSLAGATWGKVLTAGPLIALGVLTAPLLARGLNALAMGEAAAGHMGVPLEKLKTGAILIVAASVGAAVAVSGAIGFVGIVVPHLLRLATGPDHRTLLPNAAVLGAALLVLADALSRTVVAPAELPIGIITAVIGAPVFLWILLHRRHLVDL
ncbi:MAG: iron ABC transporter permease [Pseudomonadota bacterium]